jgi:exosortase
MLPAGRLNRALLFIAAIGLLPLLADLGQRLWANEPYRFFPLAWVCGLVVWASRFARTPASERSHGVGVAIFAGLALMLGVFSLLRWSPWSGGLAVVAMMAAGSWARAGKRAVGTLFPPLALIAISFPLPLGLDNVFMLELKKVAVLVSSSLLDLLGIVHMRSGTVIELPKSQLMVEDACSGIQSFMAVAAFATLMFVLERRPWWHWVLLSIFASVVVIASNVVRITLGTYLLVTRGWDLLNGTPHLIFGAVIFVVELMLVFSFDRFLAFFEVGVRLSASGAVSGFGTKKEERTDAYANPLAVPAGAGRFGFGLMAALAVFGVAAGARGVAQMAGRVPANGAEGAETYGPADYPELVFTLPKEVAGWTQGETVPEERAIETIGLRSKVWVFSRGDLRVFASIDYPFDHFHDLLNCYRTAGWESNESGSLPALTPGRPPIAYLNLARRGFDRTEVWYTNCFSDGRWSGSAAAEAGDARNVSVWDRVVRKSLATQVEANGEIQFRTQICWTGLAPLLELDRRAIRELYEQLSAELAGQVKSQLEKTK